MLLSQQEIECGSLTCWSLLAVLLSALAMSGDERVNNQPLALALLAVHKQLCTASGTYNSCSCK